MCNSIVAVLCTKRRGVNNFRREYFGAEFSARLAPPPDAAGRGRRPWRHWSRPRSRGRCSLNVEIPVNIYGRIHCLWNPFRYQPLRESFGTGILPRECLPYGKAVLRNSYSLRLSPYDTIFSKRAKDNSPPDPGIRFSLNVQVKTSRVQEKRPRIEP